MTALLGLLLIQEAHTARLLAEQTVTVRFEAVPLAEALRQTLAPAGLRADGAPSEPVTLTLTGVTLRGALRCMLRPRGLTLVMREGRLVVTPETPADERMERYRTAALVRRLEEAASSPEVAARRAAWERQADARDASVGLVSDGVSLDVRPTVTPDRRYVMLGIGAIHAPLALPPAGIEIPVALGARLTPPPGTAGFGAALLQELVETHAGSGGSLIHDDLWIRAPETRHDRTEKLLRVLAAMR